MGKGKWKQQTRPSVPEPQAPEQTENNAERVRQALQSEEDRIYNKPYESAACIGPDGTVLYRETQYAEDHVQFSPEQCAQMAGATLTHNHPGSTPFSVEDVSLMLAHDLNTIRVAGRDGTNFQLQKTGDSVIASQFARDYNAAREAYKTTTTDPIFERQQTSWLNGQISDRQFQNQIDSLNQQCNQAANSWLMNNAEKYGYTYTITHRR